MTTNCDTAQQHCLDHLQMVMNDPKTEDEKNLFEHYHSLEIDDALKKISKFHSLCIKLPDYVLISDFLEYMIV